MPFASKSRYRRAGRRARSPRARGGTSALEFGAAYGLSARESEALRHAARAAVDEAIEDVRAAAHVVPGGPSPWGTRYLPQRYADRFDLEFLIHWAAALSTVASKLAHPDRMRFCSVAEKLAVQAIIRRANDRDHARGLEPMAFNGVWAALGDLEFLAVFDTEQLPDALRFERWFHVCGADPDAPHTRA